MNEIRPWHIRHIDLARPVEPLDADPLAHGVFAVYWWRDLPLGQHVFRSDELPLPAGAVRDAGLEAVTDAVGDRIFDLGFRARLPEYSPPAEHPPGIECLREVEDALELARRRVLEQEAAAAALSTSLIICTRERPDDLRRCLESLRTLSDMPDEVIVVDNAPTTDSTRKVVEEAQEVDMQIRYVREDKPGLSVARNAGIREASGEFIVFTDDDVEVHNSWLARLKAGFDSPDVMSVTGLVLPAELETEAQQMFQWNHGGYSWSFRALTFDRAFLDRTRWRGTPVWHIGAGASMAFRREVFEKLGGFDERLGAGASGCSEDSEIWYRILTNGGVCRYEPSSVVFHKHRRSMDGLERQLHDYMQGHVTALFAHFERSKHPGDLIRAGYWLPRYYGGWILRRMLGRTGGPSLLNAQVRGFLNGFAYYIRHRNAPSAPHIDDRPLPAKQ